MTTWTGTDYIELRAAIKKWIRETETDDGTTIADIIDDFDEIYSDGSHPWWPYWADHTIDFTQYRIHTGITVPEIAQIIIYGIDR